MAGCRPLARMFLEAASLEQRILQNSGPWDARPGPVMPGPESPAPLEEVPLVW